jgi:hypothetical protein
MVSMTSNNSTGSFLGLAAAAEPATAGAGAAEEDEDMAGSRSEEQAATAAGLGSGERKGTRGSKETIKPTKGQRLEEEREASRLFFIF